MSNILAEITSAMDTLKIPAQVADFQTSSTDSLPEVFAIILPLSDEIKAADDTPEFDVQEASVELYTKTNWRATVKAICDECVSRGLTISARRFIGKDEQTGFMHYSITFEEAYTWED